MATVLGPAISDLQCNEESRKWGRRAFGEKEGEDKLLARSVGSHTASTLVEGQPIDKWSNNQTLLLDADSVGRAM